uniref:Zinc finger CCCH domain-containing protein 5 n=1 Tax=Noccaea caerulescens TaxID=107243 RepID=A0A1J3KA97_NOCCA
MKSRLKTCSRGSACNFLHCFRNPGGDYEWADHDKPPPRFWIHKMTALFGYSDEDSNHMEREYSGTSNDLRSDRPAVSHRQPSRSSRSRDHEHVNIGSEPSYRSRKNHGDTRDSTRGHKLSRHDENSHDGDESPSGTRDGRLEKEMYKEHRYAKDTSHRESKWSEHSPGHRVIRKRIHGRYADDNSPDGDYDARNETGHKRKSSRRYSRRGSDSEDEEDTRTHRSSSDRRSKKDNREGSSADQEESHEHDRVYAVGDKPPRERSKDGRERSSSRYSHEEHSTESRHRQRQGSDRRDDGANERKRSVETSPREYESDKDRDKSKQRHRYKTRDPDSDGSRKRKRRGRSSGSGDSVQESQELNRNRKRENESVSSSDESSDRETYKERPHRRNKRGRSQHSHDQTPKITEESEEDEGEIERWRPM